jgi:hypothetical protein
MRPEVPQCDRHRRCVEVRDAGSVYRRVVKAAACQHGVIAHGQVLRLGGEPCAGPALVACGAVAPASSRRVPGWRRPAGTRFRTRRGARLRRPCVRESPNRGDPLRPPPTCPTDRCSRHGPKSRRAPVRDHRPPHASLSREETQLLDGIPTTSPARTIVDLARELGPADLEHLLAQAYAKKRVTRAKLLAVVALSVRPGPVSER